MRWRIIHEAQPRCFSHTHLPRHTHSHLETLSHHRNIHSHMHTDTYRQEEVWRHSRAVTSALAPPSYVKGLNLNRFLRSVNTGFLVVPSVCSCKTGDRAFSLQAPLLWNQLPACVRDNWGYWGNFRFNSGFFPSYEAGSRSWKFMLSGLFAPDMKLNFLI